ncbi:hypothetical protein OESDEN_13524 [Oesophagostomum dentatum]|uniref:Uncharacterized protein n=1 Tax=Oesophagostomum dentatum TaxID=61180 RepID=A0A0B1ST79_OESDE|nr:hypothetical protein OESDEN_13524 [Oesophagostomum dentatum]
MAGRFMPKGYGWKCLHRQRLSLALLISAIARFTVILRHKYCLSHLMKGCETSSVRGAMGLLPVGLLLGKALMDNMARRAGPAQVVRTSAAVSNYYNLRSRRHVSSKTGPNPFEKEEMLHRIGGTSIRQTPAQIERDKKLLEEALLNEKW